MATRDKSTWIVLLFICAGLVIEAELGCEIIPYKLRKLKTVEEKIKISTKKQNH